MKSVVFIVCAVIAVCKTSQVLASNSAISLRTEIADVVDKTPKTNGGFVFLRSPAGLDDNKITWRLENQSYSCLNRNIVRNDINDAFNLWSFDAGFNFSESDYNPTIRISFKPLHHSFRLNGTTNRGFIIFDSKTKWVFDSNRTTQFVYDGDRFSFYHFAVYEFGNMIRLLPKPSLQKPKQTFMKKKSLTDFALYDKIVLEIIEFRLGVALKHNSAQCYKTKLSTEIIKVFKKY